MILCVGETAEGRRWKLWAMHAIIIYEIECDVNEEEEEQ